MVEPCAGQRRGGTVRGALLRGRGAALAHAGFLPARPFGSALEDWTEDRFGVLGFASALRLFLAMPGEPLTRV